MRKSLSKNFIYYHNEVLFFFVFEVHHVLYYKEAKRVIFTQSFAIPLSCIFM